MANNVNLQLPLLQLADECIEPVFGLLDRNLNDLFGHKQDSSSHLIGTILAMIRDAVLGAA